jgi:diphosphomevalonate decarboxylase
MIKVFSPANIAFVKHWGVNQYGFPLSESLSMNLSGCFTETEICESSNQDMVEISDSTGSIKSLEKNLDSRDDMVFSQIELVREIAKSNKKVKIVSRNSFPTRSGIASSASGFSALTMALLEFYEVQYDQTLLVDLIARAGSISAVRSVVSNFGKVEIESDSTFRVSECKEFSDLDLVDIVALVTTQPKNSSSLEGQQVARSSPFFEAKTDCSKKHLQEISNYAFEKNFEQVGRIIEVEAVMLHSVMLTSNPPQYYISPATFLVVSKILQLRNSGISCYYTIDAGANVHVICLRKDVKEVSAELKKISEVQDLIVNYPCIGTHVVK